MAAAPATTACAPPDKAHPEAETGDLEARAGRCCRNCCSTSWLRAAPLGARGRSVSALARRRVGAPPCAASTASPSASPRPRAAACRAETKGALTCGAPRRRVTRLLRSARMARRRRRRAGRRARGQLPPHEVERVVRGRGDELAARPAASP